MSLIDDPAETAPAPDAKAAPVFEIDSSRGFESWLATENVSIAFTTYQVGKLFMIGRKPDGKLWVFNRNIGRCLGMAVHGDSLWVTGDVQIYRFVDAMAEGQRPKDGPDAHYVPQVAYFTGDLDVHDVAVCGDGRLIFANTKFNCLSEVSETHSFKHLWRPPFITRMAAEDRCHLNGLAMKDGAPKYVTAVGVSDTFEGWRDQRVGGGVVIDVDSGEVVASGLTMPHSPRWHDGALWVLNSGTGELGKVDLASGGFEPVCFCPGYLRGLAFAGPYALVGLSMPRDNKTFSGLPLDDEMARRKVTPKCGIYIIDTRTGDIAHSLKIGGIVTELYDVTVMPHRQPSMLGPANAEVKTTVSVQ